MSTINPAPSLLPATIFQPLLNSIPPALLPRFDPTYARYHEAYFAGRLHTHQVPIEEFRKDPGRWVLSFGRLRAEGRNLEGVVEERCPVGGIGGKESIRVRVYVPKSSGASTTASTASKGRPVHINFHGGGWVFGNLDSDVEHCKRIANETGAVTFDVDYRLAPEYPFPTPVEDAWAAVLWVLSPAIMEKYNLDVDRVAVGGPSAGGHLSAVVSQRARDKGIRLVLQCLHVPVTDMDQFDERGKLKRDCEYKSHWELQDTVPLSRERMEFFARHFLGVERKGETYNNPSVSPIRNPDLTNLAPALVVTCEMDTLVDEGFAYYQKLRDAGNQVEYHVLKGMPHTAALHDGICEEGKRWNDLVVGALKRAYA